MKSMKDFNWYMEKVKHLIKTRYNLGRLIQSNYLLRDYRKNAERFWDFVAKGAHSSYKDDFQLIAKFISRYKPQTLLDMGCGHGRYFSLYNSIKVVIGIDISSEILRFCPQYQNIFLKQMKIQEMDFPENFFDCIISTMALEHILPEFIDDVINKSVYSCGRAIFIYEYTGGGLSSKYEFSHNYKKLFEDTGCVKLTYSRSIDINSSTLYIFEKR